MSTCQVNAEESAAQPPKQLPQRIAAAAADDVPEEEMAKVSRTHEGPLSQHTIPGQEELRMQQEEERQRLADRRAEERREAEAERERAAREAELVVERMETRVAAVQDDVKQRQLQVPYLQRKCLNAHSVCANFSLNAHSVCANFGLIAHSPVYSVILLK